MESISSKCKIVLLILIVLIRHSEGVAQKNVRTFIFGHSLINHEAQINTTPSQETSVPHWFHFLSEASNHTYAVSGQYGFLPQHANVPPIAQWGFDFVDGAWESDTEPFSEADFSNILITPGNFVQWQPPWMNYFGENISPIDATTTIFDWCSEQEPSLDFFIYENWPDMAPYLSNDFPPSPSEWDAYLDYLNGDFHSWFVEYHDSMQVAFPDQCIRMIPVGPAINNLMKVAPFDQIPIEDLYEDDAPHGRATIYFLASIATYMAMYEEKPALDFEVDGIIHPIVANNYLDVVDFIWDVLINFEDEDGNNRVFCSEDIGTSTADSEMRAIELAPNPTHDYILLQGISSEMSVELYTAQGIRIPVKIESFTEMREVDLSLLPAGLYLLHIRNGVGETVNTMKVQKI